MLYDWAPPNIAVMAESIFASSAFAFANFSDFLLFAILPPGK
jgi:hypothetical protein